MEVQEALGWILEGQQPPKAHHLPWGSSLVSHWGCLPSLWCSDCCGSWPVLVVGWVHVAVSLEYHVEDVFQWHVCCYQSRALPGLVRVPSQGLAWAR